MGCNQCLLISSLFVAANIQSYLILIKLLWTLWQLRCNTFKFFPCHIRVSSNVLSRRNAIVACPALFIGICTVFTTVLCLLLSYSLLVYFPICWLLYKVCVTEFQLQWRCYSSLAPACANSFRGLSKLIRAFAQQLIILVYSTWPLCFKMRSFSINKSVLGRSLHQKNSPRILNYCTVGWSELVLFAIFKKLHVSADQVYF